MPAPPSHAPMAPNDSSAAVDAMLSETRRYVWSLMNAAASSGTPAAAQHAVLQGFVRLQCRQLGCSQFQKQLGTAR